MVPVTEREKQRTGWDHNRGSPHQAAVGSAPRWISKAVMELDSKEGALPAQEILQYLKRTSVETSERDQIACDQQKKVSAPVEYCLRHVMVLCARADGGIHSVLIGPHRLCRLMVFLNE
jgi:hypothetical protein